MPTLFAEASSSSGGAFGQAAGREASDQPWLVTAWRGGMAAAMWEGTCESTASPLHSCKSTTEISPGHLHTPRKALGCWFGGIIGVDQRVYALRSRACEGHAPAAPANTICSMRIPRVCDLRHSLRGRRFRCIAGCQGGRSAAFRPALEEGVTSSLSTARLC
jgi:hypothetical protein